MATLICAKCNQPIDEENAVECPFCWEIYHKECWEDTENCVTCKKYNPIYEMAQAQKEVEAPITAPTIPVVNPPRIK